MSRDAKPLNPFLVALVVIGVVGLVLAAILGGATARLPEDPLSADLLGVVAAWSLAVGLASILGALVVAAVRWRPRPPTEPERTWSISYPDDES